MQPPAPLPNLPSLQRAQLPFCKILSNLLKGIATMNIENKEKEIRDPDALEDQDGGGGPSMAADLGVSEALEEHRLTPAEVERLRDEAAKANEHWEQMLRVAADFENFKKRAARERQEVSKYANESLLQKLIPILDNFDMALASAGTAQDSTVQQLQTGVGMIHQQLKTALAEAGLEEVDASNKKFDPNWHEAISQ